MASGPKFLPPEDWKRRRFCRWAMRGPGHFREFAYELLNDVGVLLITCGFEWKEKDVDSFPIQANCVSCQKQSHQKAFSIDIYFNTSYRHQIEIRGRILLTEPPHTFLTSVDVVKYKDEALKARLLTAYRSLPFYAWQKDRLIQKAKNGVKAQIRFFESGQDAHNLFVMQLNSEQ